MVYEKAHGVKAFLIFIGMVPLALFAQIKIDKQVKSEYDQLFSNFPSEISKAEKSPYILVNLGFLTALETDTLNKVQWKNTSKVEIRDKDKKLNAEENPSGEEIINEKEPALLECSCNYKGDTLVIKAGDLMFSTYQVVVTIWGNQHQAAYHETRQEALLKTNLETPKSSSIMIPATMEYLVLNRNPEKAKKALYGKMRVTSDAFYDFTNGSGFKDKYMYKKIALQFYFKCNKM